MTAPSAKILLALFLFTFSEVSFAQTEYIWETYRRGKNTASPHQWPVFGVSTAVNASDPSVLALMRQSCALASYNITWSNGVGLPWSGTIKWGVYGTGWSCGFINIQAEGTPPDGENSCPPVGDTDYGFDEESGTCKPLLYAEWSFRIVGENNCVEPEEVNPDTGVCEVPDVPCAAGKVFKHNQCVIPPGGGCVGNPCDPATGNKFQREVDLRSSIPELSIIRTYNSGSTEDIGFGVGWTSTFHRMLKVDGDKLIVRLGSGREEPVIKILGEWSGDADAKYVVTENATGFTVTTPSGYTENYDVSGKVVSVTAPTGQTISYSYTDGKLATVTGPFGHAVNFSYDLDNRISTITAADGSLFSYYYDTSGNLQSVSYPPTPGSRAPNPVRRYHYEKSAFPNHLTGITNENDDRYASFDYDDEGRAVLTEHATTTNPGPQEKFSLVYDSTIQTTVTDAVGTNTIYTFSKNLGVPKLISRINSSDGKELTQSFDNQNNLISRTDEEGRTTIYTYNAQNQRQSMTEAKNTEQERLTTYEYVSPEVDLVNKVISPSVLPGQNRETITDYNPDLTINSVTVTGFKPDGTPVSRTTSFEYNSLGQVSQIDGPRTDVSDITTIVYFECTDGSLCGKPASVRNALGQTFSFKNYDNDGRLLFSIDPIGRETTYAYDGRGRLLSVTLQEPGSIIDLIPFFSQREKRTFVFEYSESGQIKSVQTPGGNSVTYTYDAAQDLRSATDSLGNMVQFGYDQRGNRSSAELYNTDNTLAQSLTAAYDLRNQLEEINAGGSVSRLVNDGVGNVTSMTDPNNNPSTILNHDPLDRLKQVEDARGGQSVIQYDVGNRPTSVTSPNNANTTYTYDDLGNLLSETSPDRGLTLYTHDEAGNVTSVTDARNITVSYTYDPLGRVTAVDYPGTEEDVSFTYDHCDSGIGRMCLATDESGTTSFGYDIWGNTIEERRTQGGYEYATLYTYDTDNHISTMQYPSGRQVRYVRNSVGRVTDVLLSYMNGPTATVVTGRSHRADGLLSAQTFGDGTLETRPLYDLRGNIETQTLSGLESRGYAYDANDNLLSRSQTENSRGYDYDELNRLILDKPNGSPNTIANYIYNYDSSGNRLSIVTDGVNKFYTYSPNSNVLATNDGKAITHDSAGSQTNSHIRRQEFTYNAAGRLESHDRRGRRRDATYKYDYQGRRTQKLKSSSDTVYHYNLAGQLIAESDGNSGNPTVEYTWAENTPVMHSTLNLDGNGNLIELSRTFIVSDHLGIPRIGLSAGQVVWRWDSDAFGSIPPNEDPDGDGTKIVINLRFPGQYFDEESQLHYNWNRYYDPSTGRYITSDPIGLSGGLNTFSYANGNPNKFVDPTGLVGLLWGTDGPIGTSPIAVGLRLMTRSAPLGGGRDMLPPGLEPDPTTDVGDLGPPSNDEHCDNDYCLEWFKRLERKKKAIQAKIDHFSYLVDVVHKDEKPHWEYHNRYTWRRLEMIMMTWNNELDAYLAAGCRLYQRWDYFITPDHEWDFMLNPKFMNWVREQDDPD